MVFSVDVMDVGAEEEIVYGIWDAYFHY